MVMSAFDGIALHCIGPPFDVQANQHFARPWKIQHCESVQCTCPWNLGALTARNMNNLDVPVHR
jgi:hypothetical protein